MAAEIDKSNLVQKPKIKICIGRLCNDMFKIKNFFNFLQDGELKQTCVHTYGATPFSLLVRKWVHIDLVGYFV